MKNLNTSSKSIGNFFELYIIRKLKEEGYAVLEHSWEASPEELGIIIKKEKTIVFVEVKARGSSTIEEPEKSVDREKMYNIYRGAKKYLKSLESADIDITVFDYRFDVIGIRYDDNYNIVNYKHYENFYTAENILQ
jgi:putative endonuclease